MDKNHFIEKIVRNFYKKAMSDILIGYQFAKIINFESHIPRIIEFWKIQLNNELVRSTKERNEVHLTDEKSHFNLIQVHRPLNINPGEVGRWAVLFLQTLNEEKEYIDKNITVGSTVFSRDQMFVLLVDWDKKIRLFEKKFYETPLLFSSRTGGIVNRMDKLKK